MANVISDLIKKFTVPTSSLIGKNSFLIGLEGIEGAGKSTQAKRLQKYWSSCELGYRVCLYREPGGTVLGESLRQAILGYKSELAPLSPLAQAYLFAAARAQLLTEKVLPDLALDNTIVILDRYIYSSIAYQGIAGALGLETVLKIHDHYPLRFLPHTTFYFKISPELSIERQSKRQSERKIKMPAEQLSAEINEQDYFERKSIDFFYKIQEGMEISQKLFPTFVTTIDGDLTEDEVFGSVVAAWEKFYTSYQKGK